MGEECSNFILKQAKEMSLEVVVPGFILGGVEYIASSCLYRKGLIFLKPSLVPVGGIGSWTP